VFDGVIDHLDSKGFVTEHEKKSDGSFGIKYESYG
jgi:ferredoxin--NADP+ reductase